MAEIAHDISLLVQIFTALRKSLIANCKTSQLHDANYVTCHHSLRMNRRCAGAINAANTYLSTYFMLSPYIPPLKTVQSWKKTLRIRFIKIVEPWSSHFHVLSTRHTERIFRSFGRCSNDATHAPLFPFFVVASSARIREFCFFFRAAALRKSDKSVSWATTKTQEVHSVRKKCCACVLLRADNSFVCSTARLFIDVVFAVNTSIQTTFAIFFYAYF